jgi:hypothetical protein
MADETLASCLETLSAVFILGGDIMPAQNREHLGGLGAPERPESNLVGILSCFLCLHEPRFSLIAFFRMVRQCRLLEPSMSACTPESSP